MSLRFEVKRKLTARSDRVKSIDFHSDEPWLLVSLYSGLIHVWDFDSSQLIKSLEVCDVPVRCARFIPRKCWLVTGSDDMLLRVFNYNTMERVQQLDAHTDYIRSIVIHPVQPLVLSSSDDTTIKLWNWDKAWTCQQVFEGHSHYVMQIAINPKDNNTFASASLDTTVKVWQLGSPVANYTLLSHDKGVNCVAYYEGSDKPFLISAADDRLAKIWDYQNKSCVRSLCGHGNNVTAVAFHSTLPVVLTGSEDGNVKVWHSSSGRLESTLNYGLDRIWCIQMAPNSNYIAIGYDEGTVVIKMGRERPAISMDTSGKIVWARYTTLEQTNLKALGAEPRVDGQPLQLSARDMGACDVYPQLIAHSANGRFVVVCGEGEYIIYTAMALRNKSFGSACDFIWSPEGNDYIIRDNSSSIKIYKNFNEHTVLEVGFISDGLFSGTLFAVRCGSYLLFYDWATLELIRRIDVTATDIFWSNSGNLVAIVTNQNYYILKYQPENITLPYDGTDPNYTADGGFENAFEVIGDVSEVVSSGTWTADCFIYTNSTTNRVCYFVGGEVVTVTHLERPMYILGYLSHEQCFYLCDKDLQIVSYALSLAVLQYQTSVLRHDFVTADKILETIPCDRRVRVAEFLEKQGFKKQALAVSTDPDHRFDLCLQLGELQTAYEIISSNESQNRWKQLAEAANSKGDFDMAQKCLQKANDFSGLLLLSTSAGNREMISQLADQSLSAGKNNIAFLSYFITGQRAKCLEVLLSSQRYPEAAFFARSYMPSQVSRAVTLWKQWLLSTSGKDKAAASLADPQQYENLFPEFRAALEAETASEARLTIPQQDVLSIDAVQEADNKQHTIDTSAADTECKTVSDVSRNHVPAPTSTSLGAQDLDDLDLEGIDLDDTDAIDLDDEELLA